jgi:hypothetical protein
MEVHKSRMNQSELEWIQKFYKSRVEGENILSTGEFWINKYIIVRLLIALPIYWFLFYVLSWEEEIYLMIAAFVISLLLADLVDLIFSIHHTPRRFIAWDNFIVVHKERNLIRFFPSYQLTNISNESYNEDFFSVKLTFLNGVIEWPESLASGKDTKIFRSKLIESSNLVKEKMKTKSLKDFVYGSEFTDTERKSYQFIVKAIANSNQNNSSHINFLQRNLITIPSVLIIFSIQYLLLPYAIDYYDFNNSSEKNTATAYRKYLSNSRNILYREDAEQRIYQIYNGHINSLKASNDSFEKEVILKTLEYLRDNKIYNVNVQFKFSSSVKDIYRQGLRVVSAESSFTKEKNEERETRLIQEINNSIGRILPADIISFTEKEQPASPTIEITYKYLNSRDNSLYYPVAQESLSDNFRTYYYGISVNWEFEWFIPSETESIGSFELISNPRMQFSTKSIASDDTVYSDMIYTAFEEMAKEFSRLYLPPK